MSITLKQYFSNPTSGEMKPHLPEHETAASRLLDKVNRLAEEFNEETGRESALDPDTGCEISGARGGAGDGGFRLHNAATGAPASKHKLAHAVDRFDPDGAMDKWLDQFEDGAGGNSKLEEYGLYREAPAATPGWAHLQDLPPGSGRRTFNP